MSTNMTPSKPITDGQIGKFYELFFSRLRKSGLQNEASQKVLEEQRETIADEMVTMIRRYVEAVSDLIVRHVNVDRNRTPQKVIDATGRNKYLTNSVVASMPKGEGNVVEVIFFKIGKLVNNIELDIEYKLRGLKPADPYSQSAVNEADPVFADEHPNGTHWKNTEGKWCYSSFNRWDGERGVIVNQDDYGWHGSWWFAGLRK